jgi:hypothetical protein
MVEMGTFELRSGEHLIGLREASTAQQALLDYLRARGCADAEIMRLGPDAVSWRGAVYRAVPVSHDEQPVRPAS